MDNHHGGRVSVAFRGAVVLKGDLRLLMGRSNDFAAQQFVSRTYTSCRGELCPDHLEPLYSSGEGVELHRGNHDSLCVTHVRRKGFGE